MTKIQWADETWNPVVGCTPVSPGCLNCYAARMAMRLERMGVKGYEARTVDTSKVGSRVTRDGEEWASDSTGPKQVRIAEVRGGRPVYTGDVRCQPERLADPLRWRKPRRIFVCSMSDLFHEDVPFEYIAAVHAIGAAMPRHTLMLLTKRPERASEFHAWMLDATTGGAMTPQRKMVLAVHDFIGIAAPSSARIDGACWPLPNVWLGTSVEDQARADQRIPHLIRCDAAVRFLSCEPLLGEVDLSAFMGGPYVGLPGDRVHQGYNFGIDWVIVGGESGPGARPCDMRWIESIVEQCKSAGVPCFVKQVGSKAFLDLYDPETVNIYDTPTPNVRADFSGKSRSGGDPSEWPGRMRVRRWPRGVDGGVAERAAPSAFETRDGGGA